MSVNRLIYSVLFCHFIASMAALGMPLFLPYVLPTLNGQNAIEWVGALFILPTFCTALAARFWGRFADKHGRRLSLLRAQLGLALGFFLCGMADSMTTFVLGLIVQGTFGGAMAASNGYLATQIKERGLLSKTLNKTQLSARLALVVAPISLGSVLAYIRPLDAYLYLTVLPLMAFVMTLMLPKDTSKAETLSTAIQLEPNDCVSVQPVSLQPLYILQFLFAFATVLTFPYFAVFAHSRSIDSQMWIGFLYALPHLVYLLVAGKIHLMQHTTQRTIAIGFSTLAIACLLHLIPSIVGIVLARILFGLAMVFCFHGLHKKLTESFDPNASGKVFASFDAMSKWGGVLAGLSAAFLTTTNLVSDIIASRYLADNTATQSIFLLAAAVSLLALVLSQTRLKPSVHEHKQVASTSSHPSSVKGVNSR